MKNHPLAAKFLLVLAVLAAAACGSSGSDSTSPTTDPNSSATVGASSEMITIENFAFSPATTSVAVGTTVTWTNDQSSTHTVTADDDAWTSDDLAQGDTFSHTFETAGSFTYHCSIHPEMKGTVTVE